MGKVWLAVLLAALGLAPGRALAQGCGDDDSGSSDSCPVTWSYDDDDDSSGSSEEEVCVETSDVVGLQRCRRFGRGITGGLSGLGCLSVLFCGFCFFFSHNVLLIQLKISPSASGPSFP